MYLRKDNFMPVFNYIQMMKDDEGKAKKFRFSASDGIRIIWAYTSGLMEMNKEYPTNHLCFLIYDEPKQQNIEATDVHLFYQNLFETFPKNEYQIIITTSESPEELKPEKIKKDANITNIESKAFKQFN